MTSMLKFSRFGKIGAITAIGGSFYLFRDEIKPLLGFDKAEKIESSSSSKPSALKNAPKIIEKLPERIPYLLVGGGSASHSAMRAIRGHDARAKVLILSGENHNPYMRPALSKELWFADKELRKSLTFKWWNGKERSIFFEIDEFFIPIDKLEERENGGVSIIKNMRLSRLDSDQNIAYLENGQQIQYDKCLLAPGGRPKTLPPLEAAPQHLKSRIIYFRTADDFLKLNEISDKAKNIVIVGGGFLGTELAFALSARPSGDPAPKGQNIYQIFPETGNLGKILPPYLSEYVTEKIQMEGAKVLSNVEIDKLTEGPNKNIEITLSDGKKIEADYIVCAIGIEPDVDLAKASGLEIDQHTGGYLVNSELVARSNIWVAGDASCFYDVKLGRRRVEHHDHAIYSGRQAGQNMVGAAKTYSHQPMFWSDLGSDLSFEAVGLVDSNLPTVAVFTKEPINKESKEVTDQSKRDSEESVELTSNNKLTNHHELKNSEPTDRYPAGIVFYLKDDIIVGVLMWNVFNRLSVARRILNEQVKYDDFNEVAKLFNLYLDE